MSSSSLSPSIADLNALPHPRRLSLPPPEALNLPEPVYGTPSPLRPPHDGDDGPSMSQLAAHLAHRVGALISPAPPLPSDAELEADAQRDRDRSRREAERILTREAEERRAVEERVLAMMNAGTPPPRGRAQTLPSTPSPAKDTTPTWWRAAKARLTPTKDPPAQESLTPAQQVIEEARSRKTDDLKIPPAASTSQPSPTSPTRLSPVPAPQPINLSPISLQRGTSPGGSPREQPPMYASFSPSGSLDVPGTLLTIARRFEKLERWTVSHVRALEERMGDVGRWLVDREGERAKPDATGSLRDDITELQGRITELGREMARLAVSPAILSTNTAVRDSPELRSAPPTESQIGTTHEPADVLCHAPPTESRISASHEAADVLMTPRHATAREPTSESLGAAHDSADVPMTPRHAPSLVPREPTSESLGAAHDPADVPVTPRRVPPLTARESTNESLGAAHDPADVPVTPRRVPSLTARESTSPPLARIARTPSRAGTRLPYPTGDYASPDVISPTHTPASSPPASMVIPGLPPISPPSAAASPPTRVVSPTPGLPAPLVAARRGSVSPTPAPRKRYTVALGGPIVAPPEVEAEYARERAKHMGTAYFSSADEDEERRGAPPLQSNQARRTRALSTDVREDSRFVDPLVLRRQSRAEKTAPMVAPGRKVAVGQLVAFFDAERHS